MRKIFLFIAAILLGNTLVHARMPQELQYVPYSSYTDVSTNGNMMFSSATIQFDAITISSPSPNSSITIYRSTSPTWTPDISTEVFINTDYVGSHPTSIDLYGFKNSSYTHINKVGNAKLIFWVQCPQPILKLNEFPWGFCPGLPWNGQGGTKIEWR